MNKKKILRIIAYIVVIVALILLKFTTLLNIPCVIHTKTGLDCPTCGFTRAVTSILNFNFLDAINYNAFLTVVIFPIFTFLFIQDVLYITLGIIKKKEYKSYIEIIFGD